MKNSSISESRTRQTYVFSKADGRLLSAKIDAFFLGIPRCILRLTSIDYNARIPESLFDVPRELEWIDETESGSIISMRENLPVDGFIGITSEEAVRKLFCALEKWDEPSLKVILRGYSLKSIEASGYRGCALVEVGKPFKSGLYDGIFVPCRVRLAGGKIRKLTPALRNDNEMGVWKVDGGI